MNVPADVAEIEMENEEGRPVPGVAVTCSKCGHVVEVYGTSERSERRGAVMLREDCPLGLNNRYIV